MPFTDRSDAGRRLAKALARYKAERPVVLALPRGGVPVAAEVASALGAAIDLVLVRKIGAPRQPELAIGAVVDGAEPITVRNEDIIAGLGVTDAAFDVVRDRELAEIERRRRFYLGERRRAEIAGRTVIVIDDGIATGATMRAALSALRRRGPQRLVLAVPVAPVGTIEALRPEVDQVVCLEIPSDFHAIGYFYADFRQVSDEEVIATLARFPVMPGPASDPPVPKLTHILETALYVDDLERATAFYLEVLELTSLYRDQRLHALSVGERSVLLLFRRGGSLETAHLPGGTIPPHDGHGPVHIAFAVAADALALWEERLARHQIAIEGRTRWPRGGVSLYFRDPDGHLLELATPGLWAIY